MSPLVIPTGLVLISHTEKQSSTTLAGTTGATATTVISAPAFTANGTDSYIFEWFTPQGVCGESVVMGACLYEGSTFQSVFAIVVGPTGSFNNAMSGSHRLVPTAGSHTYSLRGYSDSGAGVWQGGNGASGNYSPCFFRVLRDMPG